MSWTKSLIKFVFDEAILVKYGSDRSLTSGAAKEFKYKFGCGVGYQENKIHVISLHIISCWHLNGIVLIDVGNVLVKIVKLQNCPVPPCLESKGAWFFYRGWSQPIDSSPYLMSCYFLIRVQQIRDDTNVDKDLKKKKKKDCFRKVH